MHRIHLITALIGLFLVSPHATAGRILFYDSEAVSSDLTRIGSETNAAFVTSADATTSLGTSSSFHSAQVSQVQTVTLGGGADKQYNFGTGIVSGTVEDSLGNGIWLGASFVAAQNLTLDGLSFNLFNNSNNGSNYSARDVAAFMRIGTSGAFSQFGATHDTTAGNGNQGTIAFAGTFSALAGETVQIRLAFTDRTRINQDAQGATRVGSIDISAVAGAGLEYYFDTNGAAAGFGEASGSYIGSSAYWSTASDGAAVPEVWANGRNLNFGFVGTDGISGNTVTVDFTGIPGNPTIGGLNVNQPATVIIAGDVTKNVFPTGNQTWSVSSGATLDISLDWDSNGTVPGGLNHGDNEIALVGKGTINFNSAVLMNGKDGHFDQNDVGLTVNLAAAANWDATPLQGNYLLNAGTLNFSTAASGFAFAKMDASKTVTINGGALDNTSGAPLTLDIGSGSYIVGGDFAFGGSDDLDLGVRSVDFGGATRTVTVVANALEIGGVITDGGLVKEGAGTLVLSGNNTYVGPTTINGGTLRLAASQLPSGLKVTPMGDSITFGFGGSEDASGYRRYLYDDLNPVMPDFQYVGVKNGRAGILPTSPVEQTHHLGLGSYAIQSISNNLDGVDNSVFLAIGGVDRDPEGGYWLNGGNGTGRDPINPDIFLVMLGTNDLQNMTGVRERLNALLTKLVTMRPNARIIVANIVPKTNASQNANAITLNGFIDEEIALFRQDGKHVSGVDLHTGYPAGQFVDGTHPNTTGYQWMARQWNSAVNAVATEFPDNNPVPSNFSLIGSSLVSVSPGGTLNLDGNLTSIAGLTVAGNLLFDGGRLAVSSDLLLESSATLGMEIGNISDRVTVGGDLTLDGTLNLSDAAGFDAGTYTLFSYSGGLTYNGLMIGSVPDNDLVYEIDTDTSGVVKLVVSTAFSAWQQLNFGEDADDPLIAGPLVDWDQDTASNIIEYFAGTNPTDSSDKALPKPVGMEGSSLLVHYQRAVGLPDVAGVLEWSTDLSGWYESGESDGTRVIDVVESIESSPGPGLETIKAAFATSSGPLPARFFVRLRVRSLD